jgi:chromosome segregation protein
MWYGHRWRRSQLDLSRARDALERRESHLARQRQATEALDERVASIRVQQSSLRETLGSWHSEGSKLHQQMEEVQRDLAVWQERSRLLARQSEELEAELNDVELQAQVVEGRISGIEREEAASTSDLREKETRVGRAQEQLDALEGQRASLSQQMAEHQARAFDAATRAADRRNRLAQNEERREALAQEMAGHEDALSTLRAQAEERQAQDRQARTDLAELQSEASRLETEAGTLRDALATNRAQQEDLRSRLGDAERATERLETRHEVLARLREEGDGLFGGVRSVLRAARGSRQPPGSGQGSAAADDRPSAPEAPRGAQARLSGILGTVAQLIDVPQPYEAAIEVALGGHLQELVVESWSHAEEAIAYLRAERAGRATFLPLDTVRPTRRLSDVGGHGVIGVGADLVEAEERLALVVELLLGRTIVVEDLKAAREVFDRLRGGFQVVTLGGEVLRSSGSVTGGKGRAPNRGQLLAREREWRELPAQLAAAQEQSGQARSALADALLGEEQVRDRLTATEAHQREQEQVLAEARARCRDLEREAENAEQQISWRQGLADQLANEETELDTLEAQLRSDLNRLAEQKNAAEAAVGTLQTQLDQLSGEELYQRLSEARTEYAVAHGTWEHHREALASLQERHAEIQSQAEAKRGRISSLQQERTSLVEQIEGRASNEAVIQGWLASLNEKIEPAEAEIASLEAEREELEGEETTLRSKLRAAESSRGQAALALGRHEDDLSRLRRRIADDFGLVELELTDGLPEQPPLPFSELVSAFPVVEKLPSGVEEEIQQIRSQMNRMRSVNPGAPDEYAEEFDRHKFLTEQAADLKEAATRLSDVIDELDDVMRQEFQRTFDEVELRFKENFTRLFGGGSARLVLTEPESLSATGVDIVASPPGKRQQTLALLSGGERSLTAVALIFALLDTSPPPFCILDEVDAMLDEVNVKRFRQVLASLAEQTQFIIITHNRTTIEAANTVYGVSMGEDSVSQVVSLRLDGNGSEAPDWEPVDTDSS